MTEPSQPEGYPPELTISAADWPAGPAGEPGDLKQFLRPGFGVGGPAVVLPWGGPGGDYYGFDPGGADPVRAAPRTESGGGAVYFDARTPDAAVDAVLDLLGVSDRTDFAAFAASSADPRAENCLDQLRLVSDGALRSLYTSAFGLTAPPQPLGMRAAVKAFLAAQRAKWGEGYSARLSGVAGGDGDWAKEALAFGLCAENTSWGVYRVWSRAWLVTK